MPIEKMIVVHRLWRSPTLDTRWCYLFSELHIQERIVLSHYTGREDGIPYAWTTWNWPLRWRELRQEDEMWCGKHLLTPTR
ncbi:MAG TPA: hypothetical protein PKA00_10000 [Saprospiraceae bacterium]|nr:hypothetical protein [Saprospiraceae bacterium]HMQ83230.1 hypothetical protein [Saprospiraceae bacterium]